MKDIMPLVSRVRSGSQASSLRRSRDLHNLHALVRTGFASQVRLLA